MLQPSALLFLAPAVLILTLAAGSVGAQTTHNLTIRRHSGVSLSDADADNLLRDASRILQQDDDGTASDDVACNVTLARSGPVSTFASPNTPSSVSSATDANAVHGEASNIKVVKSIKYCGGKHGNFAGCARASARSMIIKRTGNFRHIVWAHEFGHVAGLPDRPGQFAVMSEEKLASDQVRVTQAECNAFIAGGSGTLFSGAVGVAARNPPVAERVGSSSLVSLQDFVRGSFGHTVPYSRLSRYDRSELPALVTMLYDFAEQDSWSNIVTAIGIIGDVSAAQVLITFIESDLTGANPSTIFDAKGSALIAIGYLLNRHKDSKLRDYLTAATRPDTWTKSGAWIGLLPETRRAQIADLQEIALVALALSGEAGDGGFDLYVGSLARDRGIDRNTSLLDELARTRAKVRELGLERYYSADDR